MGKDKLKRFAENLTFPNMFQQQFKQVQQEGFALRGKWAKDFFKNENPIVLELGCGKGEYTVGLAKMYPDKNFIGIDIKGARMWRGCKSSQEENIPNVAFLRTYVQMIDMYFAPEEVSQIWITFPDPQPKRANKRLTSPYLLSVYSKVIKPKGIIHLKTDSAELYDYTLNEVLLPEGKNILFHTNDLYNSLCQDEAMSIQTFYEQMFLKQNKPITYIKFEI
jgi:tRNA (guanine-N(7)-)-methyltransferase